ncbi:hypothetical protein V8E53_000506 [Lactarius tabidus]
MPSYSSTRQTMSSMSFETVCTANSSPSCSSAGRAVNTDSTMLSNNSYHYSVNSVNSYKSRKNVLYPRRIHPPPATPPPVTMPPVPECPGVISPDPDMLAREVRYLCADLLPHSETRLLPAGRVLLGSLGQESDISSQRKNDETRYCSELFIMLAREILLKDAVGVEELEGPCRILRLTFRDILVKSGAFDAVPTINLNGTDPRVSRADIPGPEERFAGVIRVIFSVMDAFEAALNLINPPAASDEALRERRRWVSQNFSVVKDLTMDQYRKLLAQKLSDAHSLRIQPTLEAKKKQVAFRISSRDVRESVTVPLRQKGSEEDKWGVPQAISTIEEGPEDDDGWDLVDFDGQRSSILMPQLMYGKQDGKPERGGFSRRFLNRFPPPSRVLVKKKG